MCLPSLPNPAQKQQHFCAMIYNGTQGQTRRAENPPGEDGRGELGGGADAQPSYQYKCSYCKPWMYWLMASLGQANQGHYLFLPHF